LPWAEAWLDGNKEKTVTVTVTTSKLAVIDETW